MRRENFIPKTFDIPKQLETNRLRLRMLKVSDVVKDYDAVMSSIEHLQQTKPFGPNQKWPIGLTLEQNLIDLGWHQKEFQIRSSFAYTVFNLDETQCVGCVYIDQSSQSKFEATICMWVRQSEVESGLDEHLFETVKEWVFEKWPFNSVAYPGREIGWEEWEN